MITCNHNFVGATLAVARSNISGRGKPCPYDIKWLLCTEIFVVLYNNPDYRKRYHEQRIGDNHAEKCVYHETEKRV